MNKQPAALSSLKKEKLAVVFRMATARNFQIGGTRFWHLFSNKLQDDSRYSTAPDLAGGSQEIISGRNRTENGLRRPQETMHHSRMRRLRADSIQCDFQRDGRISPRHAYKVLRLRPVAFCFEWRIPGTLWKWESRMQPTIVLHAHATGLACRRLPNGTMQPREHGIVPRNNEVGLPSNPRKSLEGGLTWPKPYQILGTMGRDPCTMANTFMQAEIRNQPSDP